MTTTYNGWTNYETWLVNIWLGDSLPENDRINVDYIKEQVDEMFGSQPEGFMSDVQVAFMTTVNWWELVDTHNGEVVPDEDDEIQGGEEE